MELKVENWNGYPIRFVEVEKENWFAVGFDVATALGYKKPRNAINQHVAKTDQKIVNLGSALKQGGTNSVTIRYGNTVLKQTGSNTVKHRRNSNCPEQADTPKRNKGGSPVMLVISEFGIYDLVFSSKMKKAKDFKRWVYQVIQKLRQQAGLESYQAFEMLSKQVQKQAMERLDTDNTVDYIKANQITNKAVANKYGLPKAIKSADMTPEMKKDRLTIVNDVTDLMNAKKRYGLDISVSKTIYDKVASKDKKKAQGDDVHG